jgi:hypothetical protein
MPDQQPSSTVGSLVAVGLGVLLAVGVSSIFTAFGWGGELASQTAGAASGAAPVIIEGTRRRVGSSGPVRAVIGRPPWPKISVAAAFGFAVLFADTVIGLAMRKLAEQTIRLAHGDFERYPNAYALLGGVITIPTILLITGLLAVAAGHRLGVPNRRWILLGMGIYALVRTAMVLTSGPIHLEGVTRSTLVIGLLVTLPLTTGAALLGARRARRTQAIFHVSNYFRRLSDEDQQAALALLEETSPRNRRGADPAVSP